MNIRKNIEDLIRIRADIKRTCFYPVDRELEREFWQWKRRNYKHNNEQCQRAANAIHHFLFSHIWDLDLAETQLALKAMEVAYMDMLGMPVYPTEAWTVLRSSY